MFIKLNAVTEKIAKKNWEYTLKRLNGTLLASDNKLATSNPPDYFHRLADCEYDLGLYEYRFDQKSKDAVLSYIHKAVEHEIRSYDLSETTNHGALRRAKLFSMTVCFGTKRQRERVLSYAPEAHMEHFEGFDKQALKIINLQIDFINQLQRYLCDDLIDRSVVLEILQTYKEQNSVAYIHNLDVPEVELLLALDAKDEKAWNVAITRHVAGHKKTALQGSYKRLNQGIIDLPGLMYAQLGTELGMRCTTISPYLPLYLVS